MSKKLKKVSYKTVESALRKVGSWEGMVLPSNFNPFSDWSKSYLLTLSGESLDENLSLSNFINEFKYYNCNNETGYSVAFYQIGVLS